MDRPHSADQLIQQYLNNNAFTRLLGFEFSFLEPGVVTYSLNVKALHLATPGFMHGGVSATLLDATMGAGAMTLVADEGMVVSTIEMHINFLRPSLIGQRIMAKSEVVRKGQNVIFMKATLYDENHVKLALSNGTFFPFSAVKAGYKIN